MDMKLEVGWRKSFLGWGMALCLQAEKWVVVLEDR